VTTQVSRIERLRQAPAYAMAEAAHYLRLPTSTLRAWCLGQAYGPKQSRPPFERVIEIADPKAKALSFMNLVEAHVLASLRRELEVPLPKIRDAVVYLQYELNSSRPLAEQRFYTDGADLLVEHLGGLLNLNRRQYEIKDVIQAYLRRVERDASGLPIKLYPLTRVQAPGQQPSHIVIDPQVAFGRPVLVGTGIPTAVLAERFKAGEDEDALADDYGVAKEGIVEAIRCELDLQLRAA
jgi:uncharacterized protein (DUF433 family)